MEPPPCEASKERAGNVTSACESDVDRWPVWLTPPTTAIVVLALAGARLVLRKSGGGETQLYVAGGAKPSKKPGTVTHAATTYAPAAALSTASRFRAGVRTG